MVFSRDMQVCTRSPRRHHSGAATGGRRAAYFPLRRAHSRTSSALNTTMARSNGRPEPEVIVNVCCLRPRLVMSLRYLNDEN